MGGFVVPWSNEGIVEQRDLNCKFGQINLNKNPILIFLATLWPKGIKSYSNLWRQMMG